MSMTPQELLAASNHSYSCKCELCKRWWQELGPDGDEEGNYGPFDEDEILDVAPEPAP